MKAIMISIRPQHAVKILNGEKTIEIRKKFPKDYVGWVYIYCTKARPYLVRGNGLADYLAKEYDKNYVPKPKKFELYNFEDEGYSAEFYDFFNSKVVARFWCDKVEKIHSYLEPEQWYMTSDLGGSGLLQKSCLSFKELDDYLLGGVGCAIHISNLEIFDKPKEISEFWTSNYNKGVMCDNEPQFPCTKCPNTGALYCNCKFLLNGNCSCISLTRAPQSYCFIEV